MPTKVRKEGLDKLSAEEFAKIRKDAEEGNDPVASCELAVCYERGLQGLDKDLKRAFDLYATAAAKGEVYAINGLGRMYIDGVPPFIPKDLKRAMEWYERAAAQGYVSAKTNLAGCYLNDASVRDVERGIKILLALIEQNEASGLHFLFAYYWKAQEKGAALKLLISILDRAVPGKLLELAKGKFEQCCNDHTGLPRDEKRLEEYKKAARESNGNVRAQVNLGWCCEYGLGVPEDMKQAAEFYKLAADQGNAVAQRNIGFFFEKGKGVTKDTKKAAEFYKLAADQGDAMAQNNLGWFFESENQDYERAVPYYKLAADQGDAYAQTNLAKCYLYGRGVPGDPKLAMEYYIKSAEQGHFRAEKALADLYTGWSGEIPTNLLKAAEYHKKAARKGDLASQKTLTRWYERGVVWGDPQELFPDEKLAFEFCEMAANQGDPLAQATLGYFYETGIGVPPYPKRADELYERALLQWDQAKTGLVYVVPRFEDKKSILFLTKIMTHNVVQNLIIQSRSERFDRPPETTDPDREETIQALMNATRRNTSLHALNCRDFHWESSVLSSFLEALRGHRSLAVFESPLCLSTFDWSKNLTEFLRGNSPLSCLTVSFSGGINRRGFSELQHRDMQSKADASLLEVIKTLPLVFLKICASLDPENIKTLAEGFRENTTLGKLNTLVLHEEFSRPFKLSKPFIEGLSRLRDLKVFEMNTAYNTLDLQFPLLFLKALGKIRALEALSLRGFLWKPANIIALMGALLKHKNSLSVLSLVFYSRFKYDPRTDFHHPPQKWESNLHPDQAIAFIKGLTNLPQLTSLELGGYFFGRNGGRRGKESFDALSNFLKRKECGLTKLKFTPVNKTQGEFFESPAFLAMSKLVTERNKRRQKDYAGLSMLLAFRKANRGSRFCDSGLPLIPPVQKQAGFDPAIPLFALQAFMGSRFARAEMEAAAGKAPAKPRAKRPRS